MICLLHFSSFFFFTISFFFQHFLVCHWCPHTPQWRMWFGEILLLAQSYCYLKKKTSKGFTGNHNKRNQNVPSMHSLKQSPVNQFASHYRKNSSLKRFMYFDAPFISCLSWKTAGSHLICCINSCGQTTMNINWLILKIKSMKSY